MRILYVDVLPLPPNMKAAKKGTRIKNHCVILKLLKDYMILTV
jgi:hypothetical protein